MSSRSVITVYPFERFTERAKKVLTLAQEEAERSRHSYIGTEHILLGLLREGEGLAAKVLVNLGVDTDVVRNTLRSVLGRNARITPRKIVPTNRAKKVIELAFEESRRMGHGYVGTEHLLIGVLLEDEGIAAHVLKDLGATLEKVRAEIERLLAIGFGTELRPEPPPLPHKLGQRVLVHDPEPPYRLWEGTVTKTTGTGYEIAVYGHAGGGLVDAPERLIHPVPMTWTRDCPFCRA